MRVCATTQIFPLSFTGFTGTAAPNPHHTYAFIFRRFRRIQVCGCVYILQVSVCVCVRAIFGCCVAFILSSELRNVIKSPILSPEPLSNVGFAGRGLGRVCGGRRGCAAVQTRRCALIRLQAFLPSARVNNNMSQPPGSPQGRWPHNARPLYGERKAARGTGRVFCPRGFTGK